MYYGYVLSCWITGRIVNRVKVSAHGELDNQLEQQQQIKARVHEQGSVVGSAHLQHGPTGISDAAQARGTKGIPPARVA